MFGKLISGVFQSLPRATSELSTATTVWSPWSLTFVRNRVRYHFPRPSETKRIKKHGWLTRLSTPNGRRILQRRILKGKHVLSH
ncbi:PREDICTED: 39S ribosomal protein L34, mitochondrial [Vollenhovia emeryi]|uniref:39S ribosomal protein L34, mitochondrial n=1 Tax=Vollenhovia emeryi TaxID=411798 RepID=UPI0005F4E93B|nr:PREDICTED: 39S ribosomal protein L34, mitochondrial [Vollenhovia emeryi]